MKKYLTIVSILSLIGAASVSPASVSPAAAQKASCPGGEAKTASGGCVNPGLSRSLRLRSILMSQPRISETAFPIPPSGDRMYPRPGEYNRGELITGIFSTDPSPFSCHPNCVATVVRTAPPVVTTAR